MSNIEVRLKCESNNNDWIKVESGMNNDVILVTSHEGSINLINLSKKSAIVLSKILRSEINKITEREVNNG